MSPVRRMDLKNAVMDDCFLILCAGMAHKPI